jgi:4,5-DOPA dioxygenase extradiol
MIQDAIAVLRQLANRLETTPEKRFPVLFVGHGNPMNAIQKSLFHENWVKIGEALPKPSTIICISAHWVTDGMFVTAMEQPRTIHDFYGFPRALFEREYPAPGAPGLAEEVKLLVVGHEVRGDFQWGLDHGTWSVLLPMFPLANIPVIQLSLDNSLSLEEHYAVARELALLREKGVLIIGSGNIVHNLRMLDFYTKAHDWAVEFDSYIKSAIDRHDHQAVLQYAQKGTIARYAVPTTEHFLPLLYSLALQHEDDQITYFNDDFEFGSLSMRSFIISSTYN